jgi:hypothetical protein
MSVGNYSNFYLLFFHNQRLNYKRQGTKKTSFNLTLLPSKVIILLMNSLENSLNKIAENILHIDEASLTSLWDKYKNKVEQFSNSSEWEKAVIIFSIINAVRAKNAIINENLLKNNSSNKIKSPQETVKEKSFLKLVK